MEKQNAYYAPVDKHDERNAKKLQQKNDAIVQKRKKAQEKAELGD